MPLSRGPVLIIEHSRDLALLYERALTDEGLAAQSIVSPHSAREAIQRAEPALAVLDLLPYDEHALEVLDDLRADESCRDTPLVVITTGRAIADLALTSYNVRSALVKPFSLDEFVAIVAHESGEPTMHAQIPDGATPAEGFTEHAQHVLATQSRDIIFRWIQRLRAEEPWSERDDLRLVDLIDHAPVVVEAIDVRLHYEHPADFFEQHPNALDRARSHADLRARQGVPAGAALREYALLREEIWNALRSAPPPVLEPDDFFQVERAINGTLDAILTVTSSARSNESPPPGVQATSDPGP